MYSGFLAVAALWPEAGRLGPLAAYLGRQAAGVGILEASAEDSLVVAGIRQALDHKEQDLVLVQADHLAASGYLAA